MSPLSTRKLTEAEIEGLFHLLLKRNPVVFVRRLGNASGRTRHALLLAFKQGMRPGGRLREEFCGDIEAYPAMAPPTHPLLFGPTQTPYLDVESQQKTVNSRAIYHYALVHLPRLKWQFLILDSSCMRTTEYLLGEGIQPAQITAVEAHPKVWAKMERRDLGINIVRDPAGIGHYIEHFTKLPESKQTFEYDVVFLDYMCTFAGSDKCDPARDISALLSMLLPGGAAPHTRSCYFAHPRCRYSYCSGYHVQHARQDVPASRQSASI